MPQGEPLPFGTLCARSAGLLVTVLRSTAKVMRWPTQTCTWGDIGVREARAGVTRFWKPLIMAVVVAILYASVLNGLLRQWYYDANYSHGFLVPVFVGYTF